MKRALLIVLAMTLSCGGYSALKEQSSTGAVRYMNLKAVYDFFLNRDAGAMELRKKMKETLGRIDSLLKKKGASIPVGGDVLLDREYADLSEIEKKIDIKKSGLLKKINLAVKQYAGRSDIRIIINSGECLLYGKSELDITEDIIREIIRLDARSEPLSR